ncbi:hypothetical protein MKX01_008143 [Papaver californicum]|nr:hypothetical protein MKX01_008143 [Papaver californicum]
MAHLVPVLETPDGPVFESNAIARYVARLKEDNPLLGSSLIEYVHVEQGIEFSSPEIDANIYRWLYPRFGHAPYIPQMNLNATCYKVEEATIAALKKALTALNSYLDFNTYLVGHGVTLAVIIMTCNLAMGFRYLMTKSFTSEFPHVERYCWTMVNQPTFFKLLGEVKQAESVPPVPSAKNPTQTNEATKPKAESEPKTESGKPRAEETPGEDEAPKPMAKNRLDLLPPSKMILDEWKRLYSNTKTNFREVAIKEFWDMFDPEGYSLWFCDYKYNDENTVSFVTLNKVGGFLQHMDLARKYAFGKMLIIDEWYDMELYEWTKVGIADENQKEKVNQMIEDQEPFVGEALLDAKCFK